MSKVKAISKLFTSPPVVVKSAMDMFVIYLLAGGTKVSLSVMLSVGEVE